MLNYSRSYENVVEGCLVFEFASRSSVSCGKPAAKVMRFDNLAVALIGLFTFRCLMPDKHLDPLDR